jgi:hypothetical protein
MKYRIVWARQGTVQWEEWWVRQHGPSRSHVPSMEEHVGFANFDLERNGLPRILRGSNGDFYLDLPNDLHASGAKRVIEYHGFELEG